MNLNIGDKLYCVSYWHNPFLKTRREIQSRKIQKINKKTIQLYWYDNKIIRIDNINKDRWFTSEIKALENALALHEKITKKNEEVIKEINTLKRMIEYRKGKNNKERK